jgi:hypothetical protein
LLLVVLLINDEWVAVMNNIIGLMQSSRMRWAGHVARKWKRNAYRILVGKPQGKRLIGRRRRRWVDNIKIDLGEIGCDGMDWMDLAQEHWLL